MHRYFPFDHVIINGKPITQKEIVAGTTEFLSNGNDTSVIMGDGRIRFFRQSIRHEATFEVFGGWSDLASIKPVPVELHHKDTCFITFRQALIRAEYLSDRHSTRIRIYEVSFP